MKKQIPGNAINQAAARVCCPLLLMALLIALLIAPAGCKRKAKVAATDEETPRMASSLAIQNPKPSWLPVFTASKRAHGAGPAGSSPWPSAPRSAHPRKARA